MKMGVLIGLFLAPRTEAPYPIIGGDAMGQTNIDQPLQVAVEADPIYRTGGARFQTLLHFRMAQGLFRIQKCFVYSHP